MTTPSSEREQLLSLLTTKGILHSSPERPLLSRDGKVQLRWVMNFLAISLSADNIQLAARQLLPLLGKFKARQLATLGTAAVPLMTASIIASKGYYTGLMVRTKRKTYGTGHLIDGELRYTEPVIVIDDSIGSGTNMLECIEKLEQAGLKVAGCVALVRFGYNSGYARLLEAGYRVETLFDQYRDLAPLIQNEPIHAHDPLKASFRNIVWDNASLPDYLSPFQAIRTAIQHYWQTGHLLRPPRCFNQRLDTRGGLSLSLRAQDSLYTAQARQSFWHFPEDVPSTAGLDVLQGAWLLAQQLQNDPQRLERLANAALGLSLFSPLEACAYGDFDPTQHGLALRSYESPWQMGGALPNMPGIYDAAHLLEHARFTNTQLRPLEAFQLYRYKVVKLIESGAEWPLGGETRSDAWDEDLTLISPIATGLQQLVQTVQAGMALPLQLAEVFIPSNCQYLFLSVYASGKAIACVGLQPQGSETLISLVRHAASDPRWQAIQGQVDQDLLIKLSFLSEKRYLGRATDLSTLKQWVLGVDTISLQADPHFALILAAIAGEQNWSATQLNHELYTKAGLHPLEQAVDWYAYRSREWGMRANQLYYLAPDFPVPPIEIANPLLMEQFYWHFLQQQRQLGVFHSDYAPHQHQASLLHPLRNTAQILALLAQYLPNQETWQDTWYYLQESDLRSATLLDKSFLALAWLYKSELNPKEQTQLTHCLAAIQASMNSHGQFPKVQCYEEQVYYGHPLLALLVAFRLGYAVNTDQLSKASEVIIEYAYELAPLVCYPNLLLILTQIAQTCEPSSDDASYQLLVSSIEKLSLALLAWQQTNGCFLPEQTRLSPNSYTAHIAHALVVTTAYLKTAKPALAQRCQQAVDTALHYLQTRTLQAKQQVYFPFGNYVVGGVYSGLPTGLLNIKQSALTLHILLFSQSISKEA